jgi:GNAT superfamily N-acetyltransferase
MLPHLARTVDRCPWIYESTRRLIGLLPGNWLRVRLFGVYSIEPSGDPTCSNSSVVVREVARKAELGHAGGLSPTPIIQSWDGLTRRCVVAFLNGEPVGVLWLAQNTFDEEELGLRWELSADEWWIFAAHVRRDVRRQGIYRTLMQFTIRKAKSEKVSRILLAVTAGNTSARSTVDGVGGRMRGLMLALRAGQWRRQWAVGSLAAAPAPQGRSQNCGLDVWSILADFREL